MPGKHWKTRWDDTIKYLNDKTSVDHLGDHINGIVPLAATRKTISGELSLGRRGAGTLNKRHALRGLFLCQRVYYSNLWAKRTWSLTERRVDSTALHPNWKMLSLNHWGIRSETDILDGIAMFMPVARASLQDLVDAAKAGAPNGEKKDFLPGNLFLSRADTISKGAADTCYNGVTAWLLKSGLVSMRWFMRDSAPNGQQACDRLFGTGEVVWSASKPFTEKSKLPRVPAGYIVHMWLEEAGIGGWNGHWVISNGDGTICGVNNGEVKTDDELVLKKYTNNGTLRSQFEGYGGLLTKQVMNEKGFLDIVPLEPRRYGRACMAKFDPLGLPKRM